MGTAEKPERGKYLARDKRIVDGLRSADPPERNEAGVELEEGLRLPLAHVLRAKALQGRELGLFRSVLNENLDLDEVVFEEIWQETKAGLLKKVHEEGFEIEKSLLAYMASIAAYKILERRRSERQHTHLPSTFLEDSYATSSLGATDLLVTIREICDTLPENDRLALFTGVTYKTSENSGRKTQKELAERIRRSGAWGGSDGTILRRYHRLFTKLRDDLRDGGYDV